MESFIIKTNGSWDTLRKISDITEIQIIDPIEFEIAIFFNKNNIEFKDWILDELNLIDGIESIKPKNEIEKYSKIYHIQHFSNSLETLCGINGRLGLKLGFNEELKDNKKICKNCVKILKKIDCSKAINTICEKFYDEEDDCR